MASESVKLGTFTRKIQVSFRPHHQCRDLSRCSAASMSSRDTAYQRLVCKDTTESTIVTPQGRCLASAYTRTSTASTPVRTASEDKTFLGGTLQLLALNVLKEPKQTNVLPTSELPLLL